APRSVVPESVMPNYPWLDEAKVDAATIEARLRAQKTLGVPYVEADFATVAAEVEGKTDMDAMIAYLQALGAMVKLEEGKAYRE
ncbi:MAG: cytochrome-c oxidase, cbb3-type subunit II, partial [Gammaproteobacteria bacterium]|nr:cytochrome-c oxidase, cbb3-type subunit II [Gammaproteobacteria bacterium]